MKVTVVVVDVVEVMEGIMVFEMVVARPVVIMITHTH